MTKATWAGSVGDDVSSPAVGMTHVGEARGAHSLPGVSNLSCSWTEVRKY